MNAVRVVVTGGLGFVGLHLVQHLLQSGSEVTVLDTGAPHQVHHDVRYINGDVRDEEHVRAAFLRADVIYHLAAVVGVDRYLAHPIEVIDVNVNGTLVVLREALRQDIRVVMASTSEIFGKNPQVPWDENSDRVLGPTSADRWTYASSKAVAEHATYALVRKHQLDARVVRYFNAYGPWQRPAFLVSRCIHRALNRRPLVLYDSGNQTRCFTYIDDAIAGTYRAAADDIAPGSSFNLGSRHESTVLEVIQEIAALAGVDPLIQTVSRRLSDDGYQDLQRRIPQTAAAEQSLGWTAAIGLREGLETTIQWAKNRPDWLSLEDSGAI